MSMGTYKHFIIQVCAHVIIQSCGYMSVQACGYQTRGCKLMRVNV